MNIDWSKLITKRMKDEAAAAQRLAGIIAENARLRAIADKAIAPLQDAVDVGEPTADEAAHLVTWKKYRIALNRQPSEPGYPDHVAWPVAPE